MGHRVTQRIYECAKCDRTPEDGDYLWEMCGEYWCEDCCDKDPEDLPGFEGTKEALNNLVNLERDDAKNTNRSA